MNTQNQPPAAGEAAHTPTPWKATEDNRIVRVSGNYPGSPELSVTRICDCGDSALGDLNAAFIVHACNSHAALVAALAAAQQDLADLGSLSAETVALFAPALSAAKGVQS